MPWELICALANHLVQEDHWMTAVGLMLTVAFYLRPGELLKIRVGDVAKPMRRNRLHPHWTLVLHPQERKQVSKTSEQDESMALDLPRYKFLEPI
eukprot:6461910-Amphidinium_carterae.1